MEDYKPKNWKMVTTPEYDIVIVGPGSEPPEQGGIAIIQDAVYNGYQNVNANLIVAAPELLGACESRLENIEDIMVDHSGPKNNRDGTWQTLETERNFLKALIKKAKGKKF